MNTQRALITAYHPQADGQTEIMNQILETALRSYSNPARDNWSHLLHAFALSYNSTPHSSTSFSPSFSLYGFHPLSPSKSLHPPTEVVSRPDQYSSTQSVSGNLDPHPGNSSSDITESDKAESMLEEFRTYRNLAKLALQFAQVSQQRNYNQDHLNSSLKWETWSSSTCTP